MKNIKCLFSEILIGDEFLLQENSNTVCVKTGEKTYCIKGQTRIWKVYNQKKECYKNG
jgi:hypothetical protein